MLVSACGELRVNMSCVDQPGGHRSRLTGLFVRFIWRVGRVSKARAFHSHCFAVVIVVVDDVYSVYFPIGILGFLGGKAWICRCLRYCLDAEVGRE